MMSAVDPSPGDGSLTAMAAQIAAPAPDATASPPPGDRLTALAAWWAGVGSAPAPQRVVELWPADVAFEPPLAIPEVVAWATAAADTAIDGGADLVLLSLPATAEPAAPAVLAAHLLRLDAVETIGFAAAAGLSDISWMIMVDGIRDGLRRVRGPLIPPDDAAAPAGSTEPGASTAAALSLDQVLERLDDRVLAAGCAVLLRCVSRRTPLILDGLGATICGLAAHRANAASSSWWQIADGPTGASPVAGRVLAELRQEPLTRLGLRYVAQDGSTGSNGADGTGARIALSMIEIALGRAAR